MKSIHNIKIPLSTDREIKKIKRQTKKPISHGNKVWNSSITIIDFLSRYNLSKVKTAIDIGCGWGVVLAYLQKQGIDCGGIDIDVNTKPFVDVVNKYNKTSVEVLYMDYKDLPEVVFDKIDLIIGCDICYWEQHVGNIQKLVKEAKCPILIADPGRDTFWDLTKKVKGNLHEIALKKPRSVRGYVYEILP